MDHEKDFAKRENETAQSDGIAPGQGRGAPSAETLRHHRPQYVRVFLTFARNSLVRDMTFRTNFFINAIASMAWMAMNLGFYLLIFQFTDDIVPGGDWSRYPFFIFIATTYLINSLVQMFFLPNAQEFSELIRTGGLDFALLKPIDTQFLISLQRINWSSLGNMAFGLTLLVYSCAQMSFLPSPLQIVLYLLYLLMGMAILYSLVVSLAATSIWLGRNQSLYDFWFYITTFSRYPMEIYGGSFAGDALRSVFTFVIPILVVINVPARMMAWPLSQQNTYLAIYGIVAAALSLAGSRWVFQRALLSYRSASS